MVNTHKVKRIQKVWLPPSEHCVFAIHGLLLPKLFILKESSGNTCSGAMELYQTWRCGRNVVSALLQIRGLHRAVLLRFPWYKICLIAPPHKHISATVLLPKHMHMRPSSALFFPSYVTKIFILNLRGFRSSEMSALSVPSLKTKRLEWYVLSAANKTGTKFINV